MDTISCGYERTSLNISNSSSAHYAKHFELIVGGKREGEKDVQETDLQ